jgi:hypothetical protein
MSLYTIGAMVVVSGLAGFFFYWVECRREAKRNRAGGQPDRAEIIVE